MIIQKALLRCDICFNEVKTKIEWYMDKNGLTYPQIAEMNCFYKIKIKNRLSNDKKQMIVYCPECFTKLDSKKVNELNDKWDD